MEEVCRFPLLRLKPSAPPPFVIPAFAGMTKSGFALKPESKKNHSRRSIRLRRCLPHTFARGSLFLTLEPCARRHQSRADHYQTEHGNKTCFCGFPASSIASVGENEEKRHDLRSPTNSFERTGQEDCSVRNFFLEPEPSLSDNGGIETFSIASHSLSDKESL